MKVGKLLFTASLVLAATNVMAADPVPVVAVSTPAPMAAPGFNWTGLYLGGFVGVNTLVGAGYPEIGHQIGFNFARGRFVVGGEVEAGAWVPGWASFLFVGGINGHAGVLLGDRALVYAEAGIGRWVGAPVWNFGGGVEFAAGSSMSLFAEAKLVRTTGGVPFGAQLRAGFNLHPGN